VIVACLKWVDPQPTVDPLTGAVRADPRTAGASAADEAALEWALRHGDSVTVMTAGPAGATPMLRDALAAGADHARRVDLDVGLDSATVAAALVDAMPSDVQLVLCGAWSLDRGSGSVPAFIAARLGFAQGLGLTTVAFDGAGARAERRLDRGRRERLSVPFPAVLSVEGTSARLRRSPLDRVVGAREASIEVSTPIGVGPARKPAKVGPYRPRPRALPAPAGTSARERIVALTGVLTDREPPQRLVLDPPAAADRIIAQLRSWGYLA
jgi:electron transfer flavoprotein beta subunit